MASVICPGGKLGSVYLFFFFFNFSLRMSLPVKTRMTSKLRCSSTPPPNLLVGIADL